MVLRAAALQELNHGPKALWDIEAEAAAQQDAPSKPRWRIGIRRRHHPGVRTGRIIREDDSR
ncbi:MAG: hypothetical protein ACKVOI_17695 [Dongiaceae bacterium]